MRPKNSSEKFKIFLRPFWVLMLFLFSLQIVSFSLTQADCHEHLTSSHVTSEQTVNSNGTETHQADCEDIGLCFLGHCHMGHCSVLVTSNAIVPEDYYFAKPLTVVRESSLRSLFVQGKPWQPPRA
ncbi:hypothetical protein QJS83_05405 [Bdellovibrio sp. 22V]|uniref:hypothetical protein n=1 Tax=Bdellovibrio TaxID=958 RepID=UPI002542874F|nr:hypothetical protein [Bdellovibrio sp. 22V]WII73305.1 hypothetical protein QJS83_05405 [Bdellovibrio sp. 22V]